MPSGSLLMVLCTLLACGGNEDASRTTAPGTDSPSRVVEAVVEEWPVTSGDRPVGWLLVQLRGAEIDGATRVIIETPLAEVRCGDGHHLVDFNRLEPGTELTFERGTADTERVFQGEETAEWPTLAPISAVRVRTACPASTNATHEQLAAQRQKWGAADIRSYDFTIRFTTMFLQGTYRIAVRNGTPVAAERVEPGDISDYLDIPELPKTIDEVFGQLEREVAAPTFDADFDDDLGYPTHVFVDRSENSVDDELEFFISDFTQQAGDE